MSQPNQVVVFGYGHLGRIHCQKVNFCSDANLALIVEDAESARNKAKEDYPSTMVCSYQEWKRASRDLNLTAAVIVTPTSTHKNILQELMHASLHIFCEKPFCQSYEEAKSLETLCLNHQKNGFVLQVGHIERYHHAWFEYRDLIQRYLKAETSHLIFKRYSPFKPRGKDVDVVADLMIHDLDLMLFLFGEMPHSVRAKGFKVCSSHYDSCIADFTFSAQRTVQIKAHRDYAKEVRQIEIWSTEGTLLIDLLQNHILEVMKDFNKKESVVREHLYLKRDHLLLEHQEFYRAIAEKIAPLVSFAEGTQVLLLAETIKKSIQTKERISFSS